LPNSGVSPTGPPESQNVLPKHVRGTRDLGLIKARVLINLPPGAPEEGGERYQHFEDRWRASRANFSVRHWFSNDVGGFSHLEPRNRGGQGSSSGGGSSTSVHNWWQLSGGGGGFIRGIAEAHTQTANTCTCLTRARTEPHPDKKCKTCDPHNSQQQINGTVAK
jgi:hypothetical protein